MSTRSKLVAGVAAAVVALAALGGYAFARSTSLEVAPIALTDDSQPSLSTAATPDRSAATPDRSAASASPRAAATPASAGQPAVTDDGIAQADAEARALDAAGGGDIAWSEQEYDDGVVFWEIHVLAADGSLTEVTLDARDGAVVEVDLEDADDRAERERAQRDAAVVQSDAEATALDAAGGGEIVFSHLDEDDGRPVWEVRVASAGGLATEVTVDALDGRAIETEVERPRD